MRRTASLWIVGFVVAWSSAGLAAEWQVGIARTDITPAKLLWMSGYAGRKHTAEGTVHSLWAKALVIEDARGERAVMVAMDLIGDEFGRELPDAVGARVYRRTGIERERIVFNASHTHCGPVVRKHDDGKYEFVAAGPTTSIREEPYQGDVIGHFGVRGVIGKGGMRDKTLAACREHGAVYLHAIGGAATLIGECCTEVLNVYKLDFGVPEAFWQIRVVDFPCVVTMDSHGGSLHKEIKEKSEKVARELMG